ncbi:SPOR domain-containing protein [Aliiroseovarius sp. F47248L]|uniref:SPOR domain-containing protein n=1 Tax=Aliiroseovarius sp. F47248L TaxID=2926420 RepID=UPI001FF6C667|nr:SPOR domain-containing protein [Aliiroseovarius sp. F47248L]MCK0139134.1 SPOR domain-containing protein [Aliiroseovarius sp. F47248L]
MAEANWGPGTRQATFNNQYDQGYASPHRAEPPLVAPTRQAAPQFVHQATSQYLHPAHGGPQMHPSQHPQGGYDAPMANMAEDEPQTHTPSAPGGFGTLVNYSGAVLSLALIVGLGVWGYKLAVRDVTGIPVVRALEGPMRVQPDNPGGQSAAHQGFAVNDVQSEGQAAAPADRLVLAPAPEDLADEDMTTEVATRTDTAPGAELPLHEASAILPDADSASVDPVAAALAIAEQIAADVEPLSGAASEETTLASLSDATAALPDAAAVKIIPASVPGVSQSPRPTGRPADLTTRVAATPPAAPAVVATEVAPDQVAAGTRLVQLGAFDSADVARAEWNRLTTQFEDYFTGKSRVVQKAQSGGKTFYRLRAVGFEDLADARRFCSVLMASKAACIPVVNR